MKFAGKIQTKTGDIAIGFVGTLVIFIVAALILLLFSSQIFDIIAKSAPGSVCKASAIANSVGNTVTAGADVVKLDCPVQYVKITDKPGLFPPKDTKIVNPTKILTDGEIYSLNKDGVKYFIDADAKDINLKENLNLLETFRINQETAAEMKTCWDEMGNGKLNLFSQWFLGWRDENKKNVNDQGVIGSIVPNLMGAPTVCVICSKITIDDSVYSRTQSLLNRKDQKDYETNPNSLIYWLTHNPIPQTKTSYYEYLSDDVNSDVYGVDERDYKYPGKEFAVIYARTNPSIFVSLVQGVTGKEVAFSYFGGLIGNLIKKPGAGAFLGFTISRGTAKVAENMQDVATGARGIDAIYVVPYDSKNLTNYCSILAN